MLRVALQMIILVDNYDSFVYNLARYLAELGCATHVVRNDAVTVAEVARMAPQAIVISPGPCTPNEAGISLDLIRELGPRVPTLGFAWGIRSWPRPWGVASSVLPCRFTAALRSYSTTASGCLPNFPIRFARRDIIR